MYTILCYQSVVTGKGLAEQEQQMVGKRHSSSALRHVTNRKRDVMSIILQLM